METRIKLKNFTSGDSAVVNEKLFTYYCQLCGKLSFITDANLNYTPKRKTDGSDALNINKCFVKNYLTNGEVKYI